MARVCSFRHWQKSLKATKTFFVSFVFITGISKFSRVGIFSGLNNRVDISLNARFATALGLTEEEIIQNFSEHIAAFAAKTQMAEVELLTKIRDWYNGFCFAAEGEKVYNPFSTLLLFYHQRFANYWFESGTPTFLIKLIKEKGFDIQQFNDVKLREISFSTYDIENLAIIPLLFQTGYLTIKGYDAETQLYTLAYPNYEVEDAFSTYLLSAFTEIETGFNEAYLWRLIEALKAQDFKQFFTVLDVFFAHIPYDLHVDREKYYQTIFYLIFLLLGLRIEAEVKTNQGRIDAVVELKDQIVLFEFKLDDDAGTALQQIKANEYYQKYQLKNKAMILVGVNFDSEKRKVTSWQTDPV